MQENMMYEDLRFECVMLMVHYTQCSLVVY